MLARATRSYTNGSVNAAEVIAEHVELARQVRAEHERGAKLGLRDNELTTIDVVWQSDSVVLQRGDDPIKTITQELVGTVRRDALEDCGKQEQFRAPLGRHIRLPPAKHQYSPDKREDAVLLVGQQADQFAAEVAA